MKHIYYTLPVAAVLFVLTSFQLPVQTPQKASAGWSTAPWLNTLPSVVQDRILWRGDHEEGSLYDWHYFAGSLAGGGIFNTGGSEVTAVASMDVAHSGQWSARSTITNAYRAQNGKRAVRLMRWTDTPWNQGGDYFPDVAYYSTWMYFPEVYNPNKYAPWDPGDGGWWNIFQFKCDDAQGVSQPIWSLNVDHNDAQNTMSLYLYSDTNAPFSFGQSGTPLVLPAGQWVHIEALYELSPTQNGRIKIWQDGNPIIDAQNVQTVLPGGPEKPVWGLGNYTDHIAGGPVEGTATIYFDDCAVSEVPLHPWLP